MTDLSALHRCGKPPEFVTSMLNPKAGHIVFMFGDKGKAERHASDPDYRASVISRRL